SPGEVLVSPGAVLEVARRGAGKRWRRRRQLSPVEGKLSAVLSPVVARRGGGDRTMFNLFYNVSKCKYGLVT
ncbi:hypothetical protein A2U01_0103851, partial [Trifolium medium]|nr:hypothetical protein [Trifolium medium]